MWVLPALAVGWFYAAAPAVAQACPDLDNDGFADCTVANCLPSGPPCGDCDDGNADVRPGIVDACNHRDDDCDGATDESFPKTTGSERIYAPLPDNGEAFGWSVATVGDVNADGIDDFVVGRPFSGEALLYSGADRSPWCTASDPDGLGYAVAGIGDVDGDGVPDFAGSLRFDDSAAFNAGSLALYSGADCTEIRRCTDPLATSSDSAGNDRNVAGWVDVTGDGIAEILIGIPLGFGGFATDDGKVLAIDGADCGVVRTFAAATSTTCCAKLGTSVAAIDDVTGDGIADVIAGAPFAEPDAFPAPDDTGRVVIFSGADGSVFRILDDPLRGFDDNLGIAVAAVGDLNGDGWSEVAASAPGRDLSQSNQGQVVIFSSQTGAVLLRMVDPDPRANDALGTAVLGVPDVDEDGRDEVLVGARDADTEAGQDVGKILLFSGADGLLLRAFEDPRARAFDSLGNTFALADLNFDGADDYLVGNPESQIPELGGLVGHVNLFVLEADCDGDGQIPATGDCDDQDASVFLGALEACDSVDTDCDGAVDEDEDGDTFDACTDVDNEDPRRYPGAAELCNGLDDDGDLLVDEGVDADADGYETPCDCDDQDGARHPDVLETCDHIDDNCSAVDEGFVAATGATRLFETPPVAANLFGYDVAVIGDVDGDSVEDLALGVLSDDDAGSNFGAVRLFSGADRQPLCKATSGSGALGAAVIGVGDVNDDQVPDFAAAAPFSGISGSQSGAVRLFSGADCSLIRSCAPPPAGAQNGRQGNERSLATVPDVDGDGVTDILAGAAAARLSPLLLDTGRAVLYSGADCSVRLTLQDPEPFADTLLGRSVAGIDDLTGDGVPELVLGAPGDDRAGEDAGSVLVFSAADGRLVRRLIDPAAQPGDGLGHEVLAAPDLDNDGWPEIVVGAPLRDGKGAVLVFSGRTGTLRFRGTDPAGSSGDLLGSALVMVPDLDGDRLPEIAAGAPGVDRPLRTDAGKVVVFAGADGTKLLELDDPQAAGGDRLGIALDTWPGGISGWQLVAGAPDHRFPKVGASTGAVAFLTAESDCDADGFAPVGGDCDDAVDLVYPGAGEICDDTDNDCDGLVDEDDDGDGFATCLDVDDGDPTRNPDAVERCNGLDDDGNALIDEGSDADGDGSTTVCDCDDADPAVHPDALEVCNYADDNCAGVDEGFAQQFVAASLPDPGAQAGDRFGGAMALLGDVDGDGADELAVASPRRRQGSVVTGSVAVFSGADRTLRCRAVDSAGADLDALGQALTAVGDLDIDGWPDFAVSIPFDDDAAVDAGSVMIFSGATCSFVRHCVDPNAAALDLLGANGALARVDDLNGDGRAELVAGVANADGSEGLSSGKAVVFSGSNCARLLELRDPIPVAEDRLGQSVDGITDLTADGVADLLVGEPGDDSVIDDAGSVVLFSGADGSFVRRFTDPLGRAGDWLGWSVRAVADLNGDGWRDVAAGAPGRDTNGVRDAGEILVFSGRTGTVLYRTVDPARAADEYLGEVMSTVPDVDGDGLPELLAGVPGAQTAAGALAGRVVLFSGASGIRLLGFEDPAGTPGAALGRSLAGGADVDGDGVPEMYAGADRHDGVSGVDAGTVVWFTTDSDCDADGFGVSADCADQSPDVWTAPGPARDLLLGPGSSALSWAPPAAPGGTTAGLIYDVLRSVAADDFTTASCIESGSASPSTNDSVEPAAGAVFFYLVRAANLCGANLGTDSAGVDRIGVVCP